MGNPLLRNLTKRGSRRERAARGRTPTHTTGVSSEMRWRPPCINYHAPVPGGCGLCGHPLRAMRAPTGTLTTLPSDYRQQQRLWGGGEGRAQQAQRVPDFRLALAS